MSFRKMCAILVGLSIATLALVAEQPSAAQFKAADAARLAYEKSAQAAADAVMDDGFMSTAELAQAKAAAMEAGDADLMSAWQAALRDLQGTVWTVEPASVTLSLGSWDRDQKQWSLTATSQYKGLPAKLQQTWNIANEADPKAVYDQVNAQVKAKALAGRINYRVVWQGGSQWRAELASLEVLAKNPDGSEVALASFEVNPMVGRYDFAATSPDKVSKASFLDLVAVAGGTFTMGSPTGQADREKDEVQHKVTVTGFRMGKTELTQAQYEAVMGSNPSNFTDGAEAAQRPVEQVSWYDAVAFCNTLSAMEGLSPAYGIKGTTVSLLPKATGYRLPTEAEWEYAARGGAKAEGTVYAGSASLAEVAWYADNSGGTSHPVGQLKANALGLLDMSGNVWEWCYDWYGDYPTKAGVDPTGAASGSQRVIRGGSWDSNASYCSVSDRYYFVPGGRYKNIGFRVLCPSSAQQ
jgi:formylglycine-generating enzyme required for sulfatase activity